MSTPTPRSVQFVIISVCFALSSRVLPPSKAGTAEPQNEGESFEAVYEKLLEHCEQSEDGETLARRAEALRQLLQRVEQQHERILTTAMNRRLQKIVSPQAASAYTATGDIYSAVDLIAQYEQILSPMLPSVAKRAESAEALDLYQRLVRLARLRSFQSSSNARVAEGQDLAEVIRLALTVPIVTVPKDKWTSTTLDATPEWMTQPKHYQQMEDFLLGLARLRAAYEVMKARMQLDKSKDEYPTYWSYIQDQVDVRINRKEYLVAAICAREAISEATRQGDAAQVFEMQRNLANVYELLGNLQLAAAEHADILREHEDHPEWGEVAISRMKQLYKSGDLDELLREGVSYIEDPRCAAYRPQVMYILWASNRTQGNHEAAQQLRERFLSEYPEHQLAASMRFAKAMTSLAAGDYEETGRELEIIQHRYPKSELAEKAKTIKDKIDSMDR